MSLNSQDLINSLVKDPVYVQQTLDEILPDDTNELLNGSRKGKSEVSQLDHLKGQSDKFARERANQLRIMKLISAQANCLLYHNFYSKIFAKKISFAHFSGHVTFLPESYRQFS